MKEQKKEILKEKNKRIKEKKKEIMIERKKEKENSYRHITQKIIYRSFGAVTVSADDRVSSACLL